MSRTGGNSCKEPTCQCRRLERGRFVPWLGRSTGGGHGNVLQYSCLENPMDREAWQARVGLQESDTTKHACMHIHRMLRLCWRSVKSQPTLFKRVWFYLLMLNIRIFCYPEISPRKTFSPRKTPAGVNKDVCTSIVYRNWNLEARQRERGWINFGKVTLWMLAVKIMDYWTIRLNISPVILSEKSAQPGPCLFCSQL